MFTIRRQPHKSITKSYLLGLLHDATERKTTYRISQKSKEFIEIIAQGIEFLGRKSWIYKEGKERDIWIVEFSKSLLKNIKINSSKNKIDYIRGYFDAEGGIAHNSNVRFYIYFAQKNIKDLRELKNYLLKLRIACGKTHNPSKKVDPNYWRFYISKKSYKDFSRIIGSDYPIKSNLLRVKR